MTSTWRHIAVWATLPTVLVGLQLMTGVAQAAPPVNMTPPSIGPNSGLQQGDNLTVTQGTWDGTQTSITETWEDCDSTGANCAPNGASGTSYTLTSADVGHTIVVVETATNAAQESATASSAATSIVAAPPPPPPVNTAVPAILGTAQQGQTLTASTGTWSNNPTSFAYQWESCSGACSAISLATGSTYTVAAADVGKTIEVQVTASNATGAGAAATSAPTALVTPLLPVNSGLPTITGTAQQGQTLTSGNGTWTNAPSSFTYQWQGCTATCTAIAGATNATYVVAATDVATTIVVQVTAHNGGGASAPASSAATAVVTTAAPANTVLPTITGNAQQGQTLTAGTGTWLNTPTFTYQWLSCTTSCTAIPGATSTTYVPVAADVNMTIEVQVTGTNTFGTASVISATTAVVVPPVPTLVFAPSITGTAQQGSVLSAHHGGWTNSPTSYAIQWTRCDGTGNSCSAIAGATGATYTPTAADVGGTILVAETASNAGGASAQALSALTGAVTTPTGTIPIPSLTSPPTLFGTARQGQTLVESHGTWTNNPSSFTYEWARCAGSACTGIPGATAQSYTLTAADVGRTIVVSETAANAGGSSEAAASSHSAIVGATSTVSLVVSPAASVTGQTVTLVATVNSSSGNVGLSGSVTFLSGFTAIGGCAGKLVNTAGQSVSVVCQASFPAGARQFAAVFTPAAGSIVAGSSSASQPLSVAKSGTSISLQTPTQVAINGPARYTATVVAPVANSGPFSPDGVIAFLDGGKPISGCRSQALSHSTATCTVRYSAVARHRISASYTGNANFDHSRSPTRAVRVVKKGFRPGPLGSISSIVQWKFFYHPLYTQVLVLRATGLTSGSKLLVDCKGSGCPFKQRSIAPSSGCQDPGGGACLSNSTIDLLPNFHKRHLRVGSRITIRITRPNWVGKYYAFTMQRGQPPGIVVNCLAPGSSRPGVGC